MERNLPGEFFAQIRHFLAQEFPSGRKVTLTGPTDVQLVIVLVSSSPQNYAVCHLVG